MKHNILIIGILLSLLVSPLMQTGCSTNDPEYSGSSSGSSSSSYEYVKSSRALKLTVVQSKVSRQGTESVSVYQKGSKLYIKIGSSYYGLHNNSSSKFMGVSVSSYKYWALKSSGSTNYYYLN